MENKVKLEIVDYKDQLELKVPMEDKVQLDYKVQQVK